MINLTYIYIHIFPTCSPPHSCKLTASLSTNVYISSTLISESFRKGAAGFLWVQLIGKVLSKVQAISRCQMSQVEILQMEKEDRADIPALHGVDIHPAPKIPVGESHFVFNVF